MSASGKHDAIGEETSPKHLPRRRFLRRALIGGGALLASGTLWSAFGERTWTAAHHVSVPIPDLPPALEGFTIAHLSDLHRGPFVSADHIRQAAAIALSHSPDLIVLTGDHISYKATYAASCAQALSALEAPHGIFAVLGNHEYWTGAVDRAANACRDAGARLLVNEAVPIDVGDARFCLCGVDDIWEGRPDLDATLANVAPDHVKILLCHEPDFAVEAAKHGIHLQLSGHSHGGQVRLPGSGPIVLPTYAHKDPYRLQRVAHTPPQVYTTTGVGVTFPPVRINCRPEVAILRLTRA